MSFSLRERQVLRLLQDEYEAKGYAFFAYPPSNVLPEWVLDYKPDAVALKDGDKIAFEIIDREGRHEPLARVSERFKDRQGWSFVVVYTPTGREGEGLKALRAEEIEQRLRSVEKLVNEDELDAAIMMSWAALEAATRIVYVDHAKGAGKSFSGRELVELLARSGLIDQKEGEDLRVIASKRNDVAHGYGAKVLRGDIHKIVQHVVRISQQA